MNQIRRFLFPVLSSPPVTEHIIMSTPFRRQLYVLLNTMLTCISHSSRHHRYRWVSSGSCYLPSPRVHRGNYAARRFRASRCIASMGYHDRCSRSVQYTFFAVTLKRASTPATDIPFWSCIHRSLAFVRVTFPPVPRTSYITPPFLHHTAPTPSQNLCPIASLFVMRRGL